MNEKPLYLNTKACAKRRCFVGLRWHRTGLRAVNPFAVILQYFWGYKGVIGLFFGFKTKELDELPE